MKGYAQIGTLYLLREPKGDKNLVWAVIENNSNDETSTLVVVEECPKKGMKAKVSAKWLYEREPFGPILPPSDEIVIENGIEFVKSKDSMEKYNEEMNKLILLLGLIIDSDEYTMLVESMEDENTLEYGIVGQKMKKVKFNNLNGETFWEFIYKGICKIAPYAIVNFMNVNSFGNIHSSVVIDLNDKVSVMITNRDHKYDKFISTLQDIMQNSEECSEKINNQKGPILSRKIRPLR